MPQHSTATPDEKDPHTVAEMFDDVAPQYDATNTLLSLGLDARWRRATRSALALRPGEACVDIAAGTGVSTEELAHSGARVIGCDFSLGMLREGKQARPDTELIAADALALPLANASVDAVTVSFGLRNVSDPLRALREMKRVLKPGGRAVICEFSTPPAAFIRWGHSVYLQKILPQLARVTASHPDAYRYLSSSIALWPDQQALAELMQDAGFTKVQWRNLTFGTVALHRGY